MPEIDLVRDSWRARNLRSNETSFFLVKDPAINAGGTNAAINVKEISLVPRMRL